MSQLELVAMVVRGYDAAIRFLVDVLDYGRVALFLDLEGNRWDLLGPDPRR